ncbi:hypothetical protein [Aureispira anguillae]|uniref:Uncharacterized protein n=1 Tax=Aureispira anguillae TaxID=2864201 RepID=A0A916DQN8_9BACT|nr:hypothetical protein [Aureispira anguillae]BDS09822.1 hypothetical protein AsAng_0005270 [Aureispira anguillae]
MRQLLWIVLFALFTANTSIKAQKSDSLLDERTKMLLFTSIEADGNYGCKITWDDWVKTLENHYEYLKIEHTHSKKFILPKNLDTIGTSYRLQLFKIKSFNSENQSRFLLQYTKTSLRNNVWLRVDGYVENDLNLLFDHFIRQGTKKKDLKIILQEWEKSDELYKELDLFCKLKGYLNRKKELSCFKSAFYIGINDATIGASPLKENELNSPFSRVPLYGFFWK